MISRLGLQLEGRSGEWFKSRFDAKYQALKFIEVYYNQMASFETKLSQFRCF